MPAPLQTLRWHLGGRRVCQDGITWWPVGVEGKNSLILPGAQIYSKLEEDGHSPAQPGGRARLAQAAPPPTHQSRQHLEECLFHDPEERSGQQPRQSKKGEGVATT